MGPSDFGWAVVCNEDMTLECCKCSGLLEPEDVAALIRTLPGSNFEIWCPNCMLWLVQKAATAILQETDGVTM